MSLNSAVLWTILTEKYPDGVDVQAVGQKTVIETTLEFPSNFDPRGYEMEEDNQNSASVFPFGASSAPKVVENTIHLTEVEPETGIYTAMSEITHRVYVYVDVAEHGVV